MKKIKVIVIFFLSMMLVTAPAYAYLDPGTASMLLQALIGTVAGVFLVGGVYWAKVKAFFSRSRQSKKDDINKNSD